MYTHNIFNVGFQTICPVDQLLEHGGSGRDTGVHTVSHGFLKVGLFVCSLMVAQLACVIGVLALAARN